MNSNEKTALTPTSLLNRAKRKLGISHFILPFTDNELLEILKDDTLLTFSIYFPYNITLPLNLDQLKKVDGFRNKYYLDISMYGGLSVIEVENLKYQGFIQDAYYYPNTTGLDSYSLFASIQMQANVEAMNSVPITFNYEEPNILVIDEPGFDFNTQLRADLLVTHPANLSTVKITYKDYLLQLYMIDLKIALYAALKYMDKIDTTFGQIDLKIDDWNSAEADRESLLEKWDDKFLVHRKKRIWRG